MKTIKINANIDWKELKKQKLVLLKVIKNLEHNEQKDKANDLNGILNFIDSIQDNAVDLNGIPENEVFGDLNND